MQGPRRKCKVGRQAGAVIGSCGGLWGFLSLLRDRPQGSPGFSREAGYLDLCKTVVKPWEGQTKFLCGWTWRQAHQFADSTLHEEHTSPERTSLVRGKAGTQTGSCSSNSFRASAETNGPACQPSYERVSLSHTPAETQGSLWEIATFRLPCCQPACAHVYCSPKAEDTWQATGLSESP